jgi:hypothetical protein
VGYHLGLDRWLVGESKGSDLVTAEEQLASTLIGLLAKEPASSGKIDLQIHIRGEQFDKLPNEGLSGYHLQSNDNFLGHYNEEISGSIVKPSASGLWRSGKVNDV